MSVVGPPAYAGIWVYAELRIYSLFIKLYVRIFNGTVLETGFEPVNPYENRS